MAGTKIGGQHAAETNKKRYGEDFYKRLGAIGGAKRGPKGFGCQEVGEDGLTGYERARIAGSKGGRISRGGGRPAIQKYEVQAAKSLDGLKRPLKISVVER